MVEKNSKIRISNPEINQVSFDLSLIGRKFIPVQRLKTAISMKETDSESTFNKITFFPFYLLKKVLTVGAVKDQFAHLRAG